MTDNEPTKDELAQRVEQLEQTVEKMLPNRRQALKGLGVLGAGGVLGASASSASASTGSAGQVGTSTDRPDIFGDSVDANSVNTGKTATNAVAWTDVSSSRSFDSWFQAPSDRDISFVVSAVADANGTEINLNTKLGDSQNTDVNIRSNATLDSGDDLITGEYRVPAGNYYRVDASGDTANYSLITWGELR